MNPINHQQVWLEYTLDPDRDDDLTRWRGDIDTGDFKQWKRALQSGIMSDIKSMLDNHHQSPELSCTYNNRFNRTRWRHAAELIKKHTKPGDVVVDIGAGSHASIIERLLTRASDRRYIICDLTSPLLLAYYNLGQRHDVKYVNIKDIHPGDPHQSLLTLMDQHACVLLPHHLSYMLYHMPRGTTYYNSYSFGEMSDDELEQYMDIIGTTQGRLISENYWSQQSTKCHLCNDDVVAVSGVVPGHMSYIENRDPHVPTNPGARVVVMEP